MRFCGSIGWSPHRIALKAMCLLVILSAISGSLASGRDPVKTPINVVLVHGFLNDGQMFNPMMGELEKAGCNCFAPNLTPNDCTTGIDDLTRKLSSRIDAHFGRRAPFFMIGFSMGGIVTRDYVENFCADRARVRGVFLISSGSKGTLLACMALNAHQREMAIGSPFLRKLNADASAWNSVPIHAYWTPLDLMIVPSVNSRWPEGQTTRVVCLLHPWMVRDRVVIDDIRERIETLASAHSDPHKR